MSNKGAPSHRKNGCRHVEAHDQVVPRNNSKKNDDTAISVIELPPFIDTKGVQGSQHGGSTVLSIVEADTGKTFFLPQNQILAENSFSPTNDALRSITPTLSTTSSIEAVGIEWLKATVDHDLVHIGFDAPKNASSEVHSQVQLGDKEGEIHDLFTSAVNMSTCVSLLPSSSSISSVNSMSSASNTTSHASEMSGKHASIIGTPENDTVAASRLSLQERACLEEIERGSQLTPEERELFESHGLQVLEFASGQSDKSNTLMTAQELESMPDQGLEFEASVGPKHAQLNPETVMTPVQDPTSSNENPDADLSEPSTHLVLETPSGQQLVQIEGAPLDHNLALKIGYTGYYVVPVSSEFSSLPNDDTTNRTPMEVDPAQGTLPSTSIECIAMLENIPEGSMNAQPAQLVGGPMDDADEQAMAQEASTQLAGLSEANRLNSSIDSVMNRRKCEKRWTCDQEGCGQVFTRPYKLRLHTMTHTDERPFKCSVKGCGWAFMTGYKLKRHEEAHIGKKGFVCDVEGCNRRFTTIYNMRSHRKLHARPCNQRCPEPGCDESYPTKKQLVAHMKVHNGGEKTFKCPHEGCDKWFSSPFCMGSHARVHATADGSNSLRCPVATCGRVFDKRCRLRQHVRSHTGERPYVCSAPDCGWAFSSASKLKRHLHKHTGERRWTCAHCEKAFMRAEHLKGHLVTHTGLKPFICPYTDCTASFTAKSSMYVHIRKHATGEVSQQKIVYFCPIDDCEKRYTSKNALRTHLVKHVQRQYQSTLGQMGAAHSDLSLIPLLNPEDLQVNFESLIQAQHKFTDGVVANSILATADGSAVINPADLITTVDATGNTSYVNVLSAPVSTTQPSVISAPATGGQPVVSGGVVTWLTNEAVNHTMAGIRCVKTTAAASAARTKKEPAAPGVGSARTDYRSNCALLDRVKQRRQQRNRNEPTALIATPGGASANVSLVAEADMSPCLSSTTSGSMVMTPLSSLNMTVGRGGSSSPPSSPTTPPIGDDCSAPLIGPDEVMTSRAITFRDPETGAIYVQTQLLQDDPPNLDEAFPDASSLVTSDSHSLLSTADFTTLLQENELANGFTCTTINLQDLE